MAVKITLVGEYAEEETQFEALDLETQEPVELKNWFEKSKNKWHVVLSTNSANRKYVSHNELMSKLDENNQYLVEDRTTPPRRLGTAQPDKHLIPFMTTEGDLEKYNAIIARAIENRESQKAQPLTEIEKLERKIAAAEKKLAAAIAAEEREQGEE